MNRTQWFLSAIVITMPLIHPLVGEGANLTTLINFDNTDGANPSSDLLADGGGNLYGTTVTGGVNGYGTVFKIAAGTNTLTTLISFDGTNGVNPDAGLIADASGNLYGTTAKGGVNDYGTAFKIAAGTNALTTLISFDGTNGSYPQAGLIADASGNLYGTTSDILANDFGTVFKIAAGTTTLTTLISFDDTNGSRPLAGLIADASGNLYGTTATGGVNGYGTVFEVAAGTNALTTLISFDGTNGANPYAGLIADASGNLYGTTVKGGANDYGTVFKIAAGTNALTTLISFDETNGSRPLAGLIADASGNLYGTTATGGVNGYGTVFEVAAGTTMLTTLVSFDGTNGATPFAGLIADASGNLFGTTLRYGTNGYGTVFKIADTGFVVPETSSFLLAAFGLVAFAVPCIKRVRGTN